MHRTVMLVDPHEDQRQMYADALYAHGFKVLECHDARLALSLARHIRLAAVVAAVGAERGGCDWSFVAQLRRTPETRSVPVVALGSRWIAEELAGRDGDLADVYLPLPVMPTELVDVVKRLARYPPAPFAAR